jgi:iron complex transport system ATP-binding protein
VVKKTSVVFEFRHADLGYGRHSVLTDLNLTVASDSVTCLLGPNGVGKTTLFRSALGFLPPVRGDIFLNGVKTSHYTPREFARHVAYVPQAHHTPFPYKVLDVVLFGRTTHLGYFNTPGRHDRKVAEANLDLLDICHLAERPFPELSGGERQLVLIARALSQEASFLIFDEPTSNLDYGNQCRVLQKIRSLQDQSVGILMATHSPDHAFMIGSQVIMLEGGSICRMGSPEEVLTCETLKQTYGVNVQLFDTPEETFPSRKVCVPVLY